RSTFHRQCTTMQGAMYQIKETEGNLAEPTREKIDSMSETTRPIELFYSYAQADEELRQELEKHLSYLVQQHQITSWHPQKIIPGQSRTQEIDAHLDTAQIILLLVSSDFLASDYCYGQEMHRALERHQTQQACVIPILLRSADWQRTPFADLE